MKKIVTLFLCAVVCMVSLCACSVQDENADYNGISREELERKSKSWILFLEETPETQWELYREYLLSKEQDETSMAYAQMLKDWIEVRPQAGSIKGFGEFEVSKTGKTLTTTLTVNYTKRDLRLIYVFHADSMELEAVNVELVYSLGEIMSKAALNTVMGISVVFAILILICLIISAFVFIGIVQKRKNIDRRPEVVEIVERPRKAEQESAADDLELIAVISAAVAAATGTSTDAFVVRSIRRR